MVRGIELAGRTVTVDLALTIPGCPLKSFFQEVLPANLKDAFPEIGDVQINLGAMTEQERKALVGGLKKDSPEAEIFTRPDSSTTVIAVGSGKGGVGKSTVTVKDGRLGVPGNIVYEIGVLQMKDEVSTGQRLQQAMENTDLFPNMVIQMIAVGEESGSLDEMAGKVADFYEEDVDNAVDNLSSLLEPMIMAILGVLVGGLVVAMYLPIFKMGSVI